MSEHKPQNPDLPTPDRKNPNEIEFFLESGNFDRAEIETYKRFVSANQGLSYDHEVDMLNKIIVRISEKNGVTEETVNQAFFRAFLEGELFESSEVKELFETTFGPDFLNDLAKLPTSYLSDPDKTELYIFLKKYKLL